MNIERIFMDDIHQKKRAASGVYHRASRKGFIRGGVKTQSDFMTRKERKQLNGEVKVSNMYDKYNVIENVPQISEIEKMEYNDRVGLYKFLKNNYSNVVLQKHWKVSAGTLYNKVYEKYNLYVPRGKKGKGTCKTPGLYKDISEVPAISSVLEMVNAQRKGILSAVKQQFTANVITEHWKISKNRLYEIYRQNDILKSKVTEKEIVDMNVVNENNNTNNNIENKVVNEKLFNDLIDTVNSLKESIFEKMESQVKKKNDGFTIEMNGKYDKKDIENKLLSITGVLNDNKSYKINLKIEEL